MDSDSKNVVFVIDPPAASDGGGYILFVHKNNPFAGGSSSIFSVDRLITISDDTGRGVAIQAQDPSGSVVTEFPIGTSYLLVSKSRVRGLSAAEYAVEQKAEREAFKFLDGPSEDLGGGASGGPGHGQYL